MSFGKGDGIPWKNLDLIDKHLPANVRKAAIQECIEIVDAAWTFSDTQQHTHTWHDREDCLERLRALLEGVTR